MLSKTTSRMLAFAVVILALVSDGEVCVQPLHGSTTVQVPAIQASLFFDPALSYCKCICFSNSTIIPLFRPADPSKPCLSCTRQFCLDQKLAICRGRLALTRPPMPQALAWSKRSLR